MEFLRDPKPIGEFHKFGQEPPFDAGSIAHPLAGMAKLQAAIW
jgi:hypothetical protein